MDLNSLEKSFREVKAEVPGGTFKQAAVTVLFRDSSDGPELLMIRRSASMTKHSNDWAFPGGRIEPYDSDLRDTALRETEEEIGVSRKSIDLWGELTPQITESGYIIFPFTGRVEASAGLRPDFSEVVEICAFPLSAICGQENVRQIAFIDATTLRNTTAYAYNGRVVWGASARILSEAALVMITGTNKQQDPL